MGWSHSSSSFPVSALRDNEGPQKYLWDETMMCFLKQTFFKMEKLRGLCGFSKVAAQEIAEKQRSQFWNLWSPVIWIELDKNGTYIIPNPI